MEWHVVVHEPNSSCTVDYSAEVPLLEFSLPASNAYNRIRTNFFEILNRSNLSTILLDLCLISMAVYSSDIKIPRDVSQDRWTRNIEIYMPVNNLAVWQDASHELTKTLNYLSGDIWKFHFRQSSEPSAVAAGSSFTENPFDAVSLLSGGLDSLVGAIDLLKQDQKVGFVSHHGAGITNSVQQLVLKSLEKEFGELVNSMSFYVQAPKIKDSLNEQTMRARSFLFICLGIAVAHSQGKNSLTIAENGFISLNVPLTSTRIGSLSTRTTHPFFISCMRRLVEKIGLKTELALPYQFLTKGEMIKESLAQDSIKRIIPKTMSCTHPESGRYSGKNPSNHCGYCVPCIIRKASIHAALGKDPTIYNASVKRRAPNSKSGKGKDLRAFQMAAKRYRDKNYQQVLFDVLAAGPLDPLQIDKFVNVYQRGMEEVISII